MGEHDATMPGMRAYAPVGPLDDLNATTILKNAAGFGSHAGA